MVEFAQQTPYETVKVVIPANGTMTVYGTVKFISLISATSLTGVSISFNGASFFPFPSGFTISEFEVDTIYLRDTSGAQNTVVVAKGNALVRDNRVTIDATSPLPVQLTGTNNVIVTGSDSTAADARPTNTAIGSQLSYASVYNGTTWDRQRGDVAGTWTQGPAASGTALTGKPVRIGGSDGANVRDIKTDANGNLIAVGAVAAGSAVGTTAPVMIGGSDGTNVQRLTLRANNTALQATGNATVIPGYYNSAVQAWTSGNCVFQTVDRAGKTQVTPSLSLDPLLASATVATLNAAATTNATSVKASAGCIGEIHAFNQAAYDVFLRLYNKASAPTVGTDVAFRVIRIPAGQSVVVTYPFGAYFSTGIAYATTKLQAFNDTTALAANDLQLSIQYT